jgi:hypothetical protein|tara:strand:+ start:6098 stop:6649 length:552 start_codon:yes stop_codon:yes gene_type:complete
MNFIQKYSEVLPDDLLENLLSLIEQNIQYNVRSNTTQQDKQLSLEPFWPDLAAQVNQSLLSATLKDYLERYPYLSRHPEWTSANTLLQKTSPSEGYHEWHCENMGWVNNSRAIAWMIYLNDVEEGGETEFLYQQKRFKPTRNTAILWPGSWDHIHRGNPPLSGDKYILTGWYTPTTSMPRFEV